MSCRSSLEVKIQYFMRQKSWDRMNCRIRSWRRNSCHVKAVSWLPVTDCNQLSVSLPLYITPLTVCRRVDKLLNAAADAATSPLYTVQLAWANLSRMKIFLKLTLQTVTKKYVDMTAQWTVPDVIANLRAGRSKDDGLLRAIQFDQRAPVDPTFSLSLIRRCQWITYALRTERVKLFRPLIKHQWTKG
jgi:hypothetical protein